MICKGIFKSYTKVNDFNKMLNCKRHKCYCYQKVKQTEGISILLRWLCRFIRVFSRTILVLFLFIAQDYLRFLNFVVSFE